MIEYTAYHMCYMTQKNFHFFRDRLRLFYEKYNHIIFKKMSDTEYEVEAIRDYRIIKKKEQFLVKWKGYPEEENTWENVSYLNCEKLIRKYMKENKDKIDHKKTQTSGVSKTSNKSKSKDAKIITDNKKKVVQLLFDKNGEILYEIKEQNVCVKKRSEELDSIETALAISFLEKSVDSFLSS
ncbi:chromobox protein [Tritrichomonas foetus]|uniref:Chromobox protein n=1 Tax=Tritrichomonas foetus TaxID=1144522 RepID=A0A1J4JKG5_9EUKA|nr:chromobox protein [Tritrichomonas foetus]|eukprot:OHS99113.1 chromobox protein [Tritrichomonas foetus]